MVPFQNYVRQVRVQSKIYRLKCKFYRLKCKFYKLKCKIYRLKCEFYRAQALVSFKKCMPPSSSLREVRKRKGHIFFDWNKCLWIKVWKIENKKSVNVTLIRFRTTNETKSTKQINVYIKMYISVRINRQQTSWGYYRPRVSNIIKEEKKYIYNQIISTI